MPGAGTQAAKTFPSGIHPEEFKHLTRHLPIERMPFTDEYVLPLSQHLGGPSRAVVRQGEKVYRGQVIGEASGFVSTFLHAPVTGRVKLVERREHPSGRVEESIVITRDPGSPQLLHKERSLDWEGMSIEAILKVVKESGFVGMGGAAFPAHVKLVVPKGKKAEYAFINGCECEPFLTADHRVMLERRDSIYLGIRIFLKVLGARKAFFAIETNKPDAIAYLKAGMPKDLPCEIIPLETKYPQGAEKMLITAVLDREVPSGKLPIDAEVVVHNVSTVAAIGDLFTYAQPMMERVVTVTGPGIKRPANLMIPIGTKLGEVIKHCGGLTQDTRQILFGGPMMGAAQSSLEVPILKGTSGITALTEYEVLETKEYPCIRCLSCVDACPVYLNPCRLGALAKAKRHDAMPEFNIMDCIECGSCSYSCPSNIPLVQRFRVSKALLREKQAREKALEAAQAREAAAPKGVPAAK